MGNGFDAREGRDLHDGQREAIRQLERRLDKSENDRAEIWRAQGVLTTTLATLVANLANVVKEQNDFRDEIRAFVAASAKKDESRTKAMWAAGTAVVLLLLGVIVNLIITATSSGVHP